MLVGLLILLFVIAVLCTYLRRRVLRWLFTLLAVLFWLAFLLLFGFAVGYQAGTHNVHITHILF
ncbi:hypothetical protein LLE49_15085 [Alicyclobacillus tolerans]|uniref:hypothetical protein n=1 Tax=Alicyclobacillus tolerans TaxID=90970 RepID=UPI001F18975B|nr:hypothetical protein [Alicyclobacillus tolerans]MCF8566049.1 hypothetical protein [Alicyclobacillus tolerans]